MMRAKLMGRKYNCLWMVTVAFLSVSIPTLAADSPWGANYFPNVPLITQDGKSVHFFEDLIKDKIVAINFIYTTCADTCPLETAQLVKVQQILGDRMGQDVFFYSISIDPEHDTPPVLAKYRERFGARWTFLTGDESDIIQLRRKLGLYIEEIQDGSNNHNVSMIIGNQTTGRWMKRSPFENPYVLADQLGNWLDGWKAPPRGGDYADAPKLRSISPGEQLFRTRCATCHTLTGHELAGALGPDLQGVTQRREMDWLLNWLRAPDQMLKNKDPIAVALFEQYKQLPMPNMRLNQQEAEDLIAYMDDQSPHDESPDKVAGDAVAIMNAWIRETHPTATTNGGYMTLINVGAEDLTLVSIESAAFDKVEVHEMAMVDGLMTMREVINLAVPANGQVKMQPGGKYLMLIGPRRHFKSGQDVDLTLRFKSGREQVVTVKIAAK